jgi:hypothetical protein
MSTLWLIIFGGFLVVTDYTVQKTGVDWDFKPDPKLKVEIIYYERIDSVGIDGLRTFTLDSIVYTNKDAILRKK